MYVAIEDLNKNNLNLHTSFMLKYIYVCIQFVYYLGYKSGTFKTKKNYLNKTSHSFIQFVHNYSVPVNLVFFCWYFFFVKEVYLDGYCD